MDMSRRTVGVIFIITGVVSMAAYFALTQTSVGPIAELVGVGFCLMFLGLLATLGDVMGLYPEEDR
ncbi:MAG: hypothetical protein GWN18_08875 [Thermoplasmata archaeon]|nr:hypothetical protein [Thermoplasmata archaeon]NIS12147.1 hypothetical protein [Thermoplasmata archaeon]NIS20070.1 hypothetical protein [Thermoplasmata archaeon]NIT77284.1 hypothetical protein [Thermoplasmata archaeon]NIV78839.1 hypothetical protein [Thermoplasmata archaeon]